jgi:HPt (histidine-containing phosphotransfer) domain-containing protein
MLPDDEDNNPEYDEALNEVLAGLRDEYSKELPERLSEMKEYFKKAKVDEEKQLEWLVQAHTIAHRLAGTAGSYGFAEMSAAAANLDLYMKNLLKNEANTGAAVNGLNWQALDGMVEEMVKSIPT